MTPETLTTLLRRYPSASTRYDEMVDATSGGAPRPHWQTFLAHLDALPAGALHRRSQFVNDAIASDGVTYNVYADPKGASRAWELDVFPLILPADEWRTIASAVAQRARLLNAVIVDLYGAQSLLHRGLLPPALVFGQRTFLWPATGVAHPGGIAMHLYAADLARSPDGRWWVLADRTGGPSGAGYALQNRMTLARAFPDAFRDLTVEPLAPFFSALSDSLYRLAPVGSDAPVAVLLTPGPYNETYFEHSFLARHLGFPLVEGQDLIVRGDAVYLKTLRGLRRVHAILRRLDDDFCDPVELRADSALGIPGLLHVIRAGNVLVANALGSRVLESGAFGGFYPGISRALFGEPLEMPSIATWWCGEPPALDYVLHHLDDLVIKPAYPSMRMEPVFGHTLDDAARDDLVARLKAQPHAYIAQEWIRLSHAPAWDRHHRQLLPKAATLRVFAVATDSGYTVMPGGLTRIAPHDGDVVSMQWGGSSKDTWTLADRAIVRTPPRRPRLGIAEVTESAVDIASRVGENLFWMGRYTERCEGIARLLRAALLRIADAAPEQQPALDALATVCERVQIWPPDDDDPQERPRPPPTHRETFARIARDPRVPGGLPANVLRLHACANQVRERMSTDNWHVLNRLPQLLPPTTPATSLGATLEALDEIMMTCVSLAGFAMDDMTRDESWQFLLLGRRLERLAHLAGVVSSILLLDAPQREHALEWLLEAANSIVTFRARYRRAPELLPVLQLVVFEQTNPHAIAFQLRDLSLMVDRASVALERDLSSDPLMDAARALSEGGLREFDTDEPAPLDAACRRLSALLADAERVAFATSDDIQRRFFTHAGTPTPLGIRR
ncbi:MAG: circularly permuted type 2 ATP-grasp protein [Polyangiaceae bacterium]